MILPHVPALELEHLPLSHRKGETLPLLVRVPSIAMQAGGFYCRPQAAEYEIAETRVSLRRGLIVVAESDDNASTITHEFRHHLQAVAGRLPMSGSSFAYNGRLDDYWRSIRKFFRRNAFEMEALLYERRHCPTRLNAAWLEVVLTSRTRGVYAPHVP